jgi:predicted metal-dependent phosphotriesterase family hydrolase
MPFVRTVLGDIDPADLGVTYAHEHLVIDGGRPIQLFPDFRLDSVEDAVAELAPARALGLRAVVDAMPADCGRNATKLAAISRASAVHVVAPTGLHHERYYHDRHWSAVLDVEEIAALFAADVEDGIDAHDYAGPVVRRTPHRAGVIKIAGDKDRLTPVEEKVFAAAAAAHVRTGVPILTHCEGGTAGPLQARFLVERGVRPANVVLSHTDKVVDRGYQREIFATGAMVEYDQGFRWKEGEENGTLALLTWAFEDGFGDRVVLGMDAARRGYWTVHGGAPGMAWLLGPFAAAMAGRGIGAAQQAVLFIENPARAFAFARSPSLSPSPSPEPEP